MAIERIPRVTIIIATFKAAPTLERCLQSILDQTFRDWEIIVADGGSNDETVDILQAHEAHIAHWHSHLDSGIYDAWNQALAHARGEYVCFLGADDAWSHQESLSKILTEVNSRAFDIISAKGLVIDAVGRTLGTVGRPWNFSGLRRRMLICHPGALFSRRLFESIGRFDTRYKIAADYDWMLKLGPSTRALFIDEVAIRIQDGGISRQRWKTSAEYWRIQSRSRRVGMLRATFTFLDRLWRAPVARLLQIHY